VQGSPAVHDGARVEFNIAVCQKPQRDGNPCSTRASKVVVLPEGADSIRDSEDDVATAVTKNEQEDEEVEPDLPEEDLRTNLLSAFFAAVLPSQDIEDIPLTSGL
jgi:hypothetical protein